MIPRPSWKSFLGGHEGPDARTHGRRDSVLSWGILALWSLYHVMHQWGHWADDLAAVYIAARLWAAGQTASIYTAPDGFFGGAPEAWRGILAGIGAGRETAFPYIYPPLWAALAAPLTKILSAQTFVNAAAVVQISMLAVSIRLAGRIAATAAPVWLWSLICIFLLELTYPTVSALRLNQPSITVTFLILCAFYALSRGRSGWAGGFLALATAIKLTPVVFVLLFVAERNWRAVGWYVGCGAGLAAASLLLCGGQTHLEFLTALAVAAQSALLSAENISARALTELLAAIAGGGAPDLTQQSVILKAPGALRLLADFANLIAFVGMSLWLHLRSRHLASDHRRLLGLLSLSVCLFLFGPIGWQHYFVLPILLLPGLGSVFSPARAIVTMLPAVAVESVFLLNAYLDHAWPTGVYVGIVVAGWLTTLILIGVHAKTAKLA